MDRQFYGEFSASAKQQNELLSHSCCKHVPVNIRD